MSLKDRFASAWNAFQSEPKRQEDTTEQYTHVSYGNFGSSSFYRNDRHRLRFNNDRSILNTIFNRIANDVASVQIQHIRTDSNGRYLETIKSGLNECMTLSANLDQTSRDFWLDLVLSMLDEGAVAAVPVDTDRNLDRNNSFDVLSIRTGRIINWEPSSVKMEVYNERSGSQEQITLPKEKVAILENPFYSIMNEPNSTLKRLVYKMNLLDQIDGQKASTKLNMFIKLPYSLKSPTRVAQAEERRKTIEDQLVNSKYGIAYIDQAEQITPLGRSLENDLPAQIQTLTDQLYNQIGISADVFKGTASQEQQLIYNKKVLKPILDLIELEFTRKFLTPTARTQGQKIGYFIDAFDMVTPTEVGEMANALSRNEILSANEFRSILGYRPNDSERSDQLINKNMPIQTVDPSVVAQKEESDDTINQEEIDEEIKKLDEMDSQIDDILEHSAQLYDPVARHERYLREKAKLGIKSRASSQQMTAMRKETNARTQAMQEAVNRQSSDLSSKLKMDIKSEQDKTNSANEKELNLAEIRGRNQALAKKIESLRTTHGSAQKKLANDLKTWIKNERQALTNIASVGQKKKKSTPDISVSKKEITKRADTIYKKRYK